jgi:acetylornithine/N-succinyldiaminopimelate aminotransferase
MAVGCAVLESVLEPGFLEAVQQKALRLKQALAAVKDAHPGLVEEVRGQGLLAGIKVKVAPSEVVKAALGEKLLVAGASDNVVRLLPPLNVADEEIADAVQRLSRALDRVAPPAT